MKLTLTETMIAEIEKYHGMLDDLTENDLTEIVSEYSEEIQRGDEIKNADWYDENTISYEIVREDDYSEEPDFMDIAKEEMLRAKYDF